MIKRPANAVIAAALSILLALLIFDIWPIDLLIQAHFFDAGDGRWIVEKDAAIPRLVFYLTPRLLYLLLAIGLVLSATFYSKLGISRYRRQALVMVTTAFILIPATVSLLKHQTNVPCPSALQNFGGKYVYRSVLRHRPSENSQLPAKQCFPAGHASGGFALLAFIFLCRTQRQKCSVIATALVTGWTIGIYKMLIGDHFLSHTVISMLYAWLVIVAIDYLAGNNGLLRFEKADISPQQDNQN